MKIHVLQYPTDLHKGICFFHFIVPICRILNEFDRIFKIQALLILFNSLWFQKYTKFVIQIMYCLLDSFLQVQYLQILNFVNFRTISLSTVLFKKFQIESNPSSKNHPRINLLSKVYIETCVFPQDIDRYLCLD